MNVFPDIRDSRIIGLDVESHDPNLLKMGPGGYRKDGELLGIGIATDTGWKHYYPIGHGDGENYPRESVVEYLNDMLGTNIPKVGANIIYDLEWLDVSGISVQGPIYDVQIAEALLDQERPGGYSLERLANDYLGRGKDEVLLREAADIYDVQYKKERDIKGHFKKFAPQYVGPYCIEDSQLSIEIFEIQKKILQAEDLWQVFMLESELTPIFLQMKKFGVRVDLDRVEQLRADMDGELNQIHKEMKWKSGLDIDIWSNLSIENYCKQEGLTYKITAKGNPSFEGKTLTKYNDPVMDLIARARKVDTMKVRYIDDLIKYSVDGRIHACINQIAYDDEERGGKKGTKSGRLSYDNINLQKIPKRDDEWRKKIRSVFLPEEDCFWAQLDYSQQEPRFGVHYAYLKKLPGAQKAMEFYHEPNADFHNIASEMAKIPRSKGKVLNLMSWYGAGKAKICSAMDIEMAEAKEIYDKYHNALPFVKLLLQDCMRYAERRGWVKTIYGRKAYFRNVIPKLSWDDKKEDWSRYKPTRIEDIPKRVEEIKEQMALEKDEKLLKKLEQDIKRWQSGRYEKVNSYVALNRIIQGSSADQTKLAILHTWREFKNPACTQIQVHDELDGSYESIDTMLKVRDIMQNVIKLTVPVVVEPEVGPSWGEVEKWVG